MGQAYFGNDVVAAQGSSWIGHTANHCLDNFFYEQEIQFGNT